LHEVTYLPDTATFTLKSAIAHINEHRVNSSSMRVLSHTPAGPFAWNALPIHIRDVTVLEGF